MRCGKHGTGEKCVQSTVGKRRKEGSCPSIWGVYSVIQKEDSISYVYISKLELVIPTTNALPRWRLNVERKTKRTLHSSRRLSFNELTNAKKILCCIVAILLSTDAAARLMPQSLQPSYFIRRIISSKCILAPYRTIHC